MKSKKWLKMLSFFLMVTMVLSMVACASEPSEEPSPSEEPAGDEQEPVNEEPITLSFLHVFSGPRGEAMDKIVQGFNESQDRITVIHESVPGWYPGLLEQLQTLAVAKQLPDLAIMGLSSHNFMQEGLGAVNMQPYIDADQFDLSGIFPQMLSLGQNANGDQAALPFAVSTPLLYANIDLLNEAGIDYVSQPETWAQVSSWAKKVNALGSDISGLAFQMGFDTWQFQTLVESFGGEMADIENQEILFTEESGQRVMDFWMELKADDTWPNIDGSEAAEEFIAGKMGMIMATTGNLVAFSGSVDFDMGIMLLPLLDDNTNRNERVVPAGGSNLYIMSQDEERAAAAWEFVKYAMSPEAGAIIVKDIGYMAARESLLDDGGLLSDYIAANPQATRSYDQIGDLADWYNWPGTAGARIDTVLLDNFDAAFLGQKPGEQALVDSASEAKAILGW